MAQDRGNGFKNWPSVVCYSLDLDYSQLTSKLGENSGSWEALLKAMRDHSTEQGSVLRGELDLLLQDKTTKRCLPFFPNTCSREIFGVDFLFLTPGNLVPSPASPLHQYRSGSVCCENKRFELPKTEMDAVKGAGYTSVDGQICVYSRLTLLVEKLGARPMRERQRETCSVLGIENLTSNRLANPRAVYLLAKRALTNKLKKKEPDKYQRLLTGLEHFQQFCDFMDELTKKMTFTCFDRLLTPEMVQQSDRSKTITVEKRAREALYKEYMEKYIDPERERWLKKLSLKELGAFGVKSAGGGLYECESGSIAWFIYGHLATVDFDSNEPWNEIRAPGARGMVGRIEPRAKDRCKSVAHFKQKYSQYVNRLLHMFFCIHLPAKSKAAGEPAPKKIPGVKAFFLCDQKLFYQLRDLRLELKQKSSSMHTEFSSLFYIFKLVDVLSRQADESLRTGLSFSAEEQEKIHSNAKTLQSIMTLYQGKKRRSSESTPRDKVAASNTRQLYDIMIHLLACLKITLKHHNCHSAEQQTISEVLYALLVSFNFGKRNVFIARMDQTAQPNKRFKPGSEQVAVLQVDFENKQVHDLVHSYSKTVLQRQGAQGVFQQLQTSTTLAQTMRTEHHDLLVEVSEELKGKDLFLNKNGKKMGGTSLDQYIEIFLSKTLIRLGRNVMSGYLQEDGYREWMLKRLSCFSGGKKKAKGRLDAKPFSFKVKLEPASSDEQQSLVKTTSSDEQQSLVKTTSSGKQQSMVKTIDVAEVCRIAEQAKYKLPYGLGWAQIKEQFQSLIEAHLLLPLRWMIHHNREYIGFIMCETENLLSHMKKTAEMNWDMESGPSAIQAMEQHIKDARARREDVASSMDHSTSTEAEYYSLITESKGRKELNPYVPAVILNIASTPEELQGAAPTWKFYKRLDLTPELPLNQETQLLEKREHLIKLLYHLQRQMAAWEIKVSPCFERERVRVRNFLQECNAAATTELQHEMGWLFESSKEESISLPC
jgi:hypothetical protein